MESLSALVFGPVPSRRLGKSLGINNIPYKTCTYSCVYCQLGKAVKMQVDRQEFFKPDVIVEAVSEKLKSLSTQEYPDYLTIVPDGEPTLDIHLGELIKKLHKFNIPIAVITNASLLNREEVQQELSLADYVSVKTDAVSPEMWRKVDKPHKAIDFKVNLETISQFRKRFKGKFVTETMLIQGLNDTADEIEKIAQYIAKLSPEVSYIAIPTRPTAFEDIVPASEQMVAFAYQQFTNHKINTELLIGYEGNAFATSGNFAEDLLSITAVHPMREEAVEKLMRNSNAKPETLLSLMEQQLIEKVVYNQNTYYIRKFPKQKITCKK